MHYTQEEIQAAYTLYRQLYLYGSVQVREWKEYTYDEKIRNLIESFAYQDEGAILIVGETLYLVPIASQNTMQLSNDYIKKFYLPSAATNTDLYMMYVCIIVFIGKFYDSYQSNQCTRTFVSIEQWLESVNERIEYLRSLDEAALIAKEKTLEYNWVKIMNYWLALDDLKEKAKKQTGNTKSRMSFLDTTKLFLEKQGLVEDLGNQELALTHKAKDIVEKYYMEYEYNRGILTFLYAFNEEEGINDANNF